MPRSSIWYTVGFTFLLSFMVVTAVAALFDATREIEARTTRRIYRSTVLRAMDIAPGASLDAAYENIRRHGDLYVYGDSADPVVATVFSGVGVWGEIEGIVALSPAESRIVGLEILRHQETPGLGGRVASPEFLRQFRGERLGPGGLRVTVRGPGNHDPDDGVVDGITGATGTTTAFRRILSRELPALQAAAAEVRG